MLSVLAAGRYSRAVVLLFTWMRSEMQENDSINNNGFEENIAFLIQPAVINYRHNFIIKMPIFR
jgi:hypothetical protein